MRLRNKYTNTRHALTAYTTFNECEIQIIVA